MHNPQDSDSYKLLHNLAYKETSSFIYTPSNSNIHPRYKHAVVPVYLHRISTRCSLPQDANNHLKFMHSLLSCRKQDPSKIKTKTRMFFLKKKGNIFRSVPLRTKSTTVKFDSWSRRHIFMESVIRKAFGSKLMVLYKSCRNIGSILCPKRNVIKRLSRILNLNK